MFVSHAGTQSNFSPETEFSEVKHFEKISTVESASLSAFVNNDFIAYHFDGYSIISVDDEKFNLKEAGNLSGIIELSTNKHLVGIEIQRCNERDDIPIRQSSLIQLLCFSNWNKLFQNTPCKDQCFRC